MRTCSFVIKPSACQYATLNYRQNSVSASAEVVKAQKRETVVTREED